MPRKISDSLRRFLLLALSAFILIVVVFLVFYVGYKAEKDQEASRVVIVEDLKPQEFSVSQENNHYGPTSSLEALGDSDFSPLKNEFLPSTPSQDQSSSIIKPLILISEGLIFLSSDLAPEFFITGIYNDIDSSSLIKAQDYSYRLKGRRIKKKALVTIPFECLKGFSFAQLPVIFNGEVEPYYNKEKNIAINSQGWFSNKSLSQVNEISYLIHRRSSNSQLQCDFPYSRWLKKEFNDLPVNVQLFLDNAKDEFAEYKVASVCALLNTLFGYQKDIFEVNLTKGTTWASYLERVLGRGSRLLCDCDVLSTYSFIFLKYLGFDCVVAFGYNNQDLDDLNYLRADELHAAVLFKLNQDWLIFDPVLFVDYFIRKDNIAEREFNTKPAKLYFGADALSADYFSLNDVLVELLSEVFLSEKTQYVDSHDELRSTLKNLKINKKELSMILREETLLDSWVNFITLFFITIFFLFNFLFFIVAKTLHRRDRFKLPVSLRHIIVPKVILFACLILLIVAVSGVELAQWDLGFWGVLTGIVLLILGVVINIIGYCELIKVKFIEFFTYKDLWNSRNIFRLSRNPVILGEDLLALSSFFYVPSFLSIVLIFSLFFFNHVLIKQQEKELEKEYSQAFKSYSHKTPRYL